MSNIINEFKNEYAFLSNFWRFTVPIVFEGLVFHTVEHAYQAAKTTDLNERLKIQSIWSPGGAKRYGKSVKIRSNWNEVNVIVMDNLVYQKFINNHNLMEALVKTGNALLVEGNTWHDNYWGKCECPDCKIIGSVGLNTLGKILMRVRKLGSKDEN